MFNSWYINIYTKINGIVYLRQPYYIKYDSSILGRTGPPGNRELLSGPHPTSPNLEIFASSTGLYLISYGGLFFQTFPESILVANPALVAL